MGQDTINTIETYFSALNPIANKIHEDIRITKSTYMPIWHELNHREQSELINKNLIKPEITHRYFKSFSPSISAVSTKSSVVSAEGHGFKNEDPAERLLDFEKASLGDEVYMFDGENLTSYSRQKTGQKLIQDDTIGVFRDEHSGPFSVKTKSQINLSLFCNTHGEELSGAAKVIRSIMHADSTSPNNRMISRHQTTKPTQANDETSAGSKPLYLKSSMGNRNTHEDYNRGQVNGGAYAMTGVCIDNFAVLSFHDSKDNITFNLTSDDHLSETSVGSYERKCLMTSTGSEPEDAMSSLRSAEDDEKNAFEDESRLLLDTSFDIRKGFEFLSNW